MKIKYVNKTFNNRRTKFRHIFLKTYGWATASILIFGCWFSTFSLASSPFSWTVFRCIFKSLGKFEINSHWKHLNSNWASWISTKCSINSEYVGNFASQLTHFLSLFFVSSEAILTILNKKFLKIFTIFSISKKIASKSWVIGVERDHELQLSTRLALRARFASVPLPHLQRAEFTTKVEWLSQAMFSATLRRLRRLH